jgi:hypothetical protein
MNESEIHAFLIDIPQWTEVRSQCHILVYRQNIKPWSFTQHKDLLTEASRIINSMK